MSKITIEDNKKYPTVGEMLEYIYAHDISMDAIVTCEQLRDYYLENDNDEKNWDYYTCYDGSNFENKLIPAHNGFGSADNKKLFVIWQHY